jgi:hypothetical protein
MIPLTEKVLRLNQMPVQPILTRLGYRESRADAAAILPKYGPLIERFVRETRVRIVYREAGFQVTADGVRLDDYAVETRLLRDRFQGADSVLLVAASILAEDFNQVQHLTEAGELQQAVVLDAVLSEKTDYALDFIQQELSAELRRAGRRFGQRLSCGYSDFSLSHQRYFLTAWSWPVAESA